MAKTNWQMGDTVQPSDMNDIGQEINEAKADAQTAQATADNHSSRHAVGGEDPLTPAQIGAETPAGAQAKADAAEQAAKAYADQKVADIPSPPVTSVNAKTGAVVLAKGDVGLGSVDNVKQATKTEFDAHVANKSNPHGVTKAQVGLGSVQNYSIATQAQAQAGTANNVYMTPLRTKEAITAQTGGVLWRLNNGRPEYNDGTGWKSVGGVFSTRYSGTLYLASSDPITAVSVSGPGRLLYLVTQGNTSTGVTLEVIIDGVTVVDATSRNGSDVWYALPPLPVRNNSHPFTKDQVAQIDLSFKESLVIRCASGSGHVSWLYEM